MSATNQRFHHVGFDLDGTLCNSLPGIQASYEYAMDALGLNAAAPFQTAIGKPLEKGLEGLGVPLELLDRAVTLFRDFYGKEGLYQAELYPGVRELLGELAVEERSMYIVTAKPSVYAVEVLRHFDLSGVFEDVVGLDMAGPAVSKSAQLRGLMVAHAISSGGFCFVGDRKQDILAGLENGVMTYGVAYGYGGRAELEAAGADLVVEDVPELRRALA